MNFVDDLGSRITLKNFPPQRIISVVPSLTELLYDLGLEEQIAGITKFCVFPDVLFRSKPRIGGTKKLNIDKIISLKPDLILANKEENQKEDIEKLSSLFPTYVTDIRIMDHAIEKIKIIGDLTKKENEAKNLITAIQNGFIGLTSYQVKPKVGYMIWKDPMMVAGGDTYISDMLERAGFTNAFANKKRYPVVNHEELMEADLDYIFLSSEPFPFKEKDIVFFDSIIKEAKAILVDGTMFSWYGSRLRLTPPYFLNLRQQLNI